MSVIARNSTQVSPDVIDRFAVQVRLAPPPPKGDLIVSGLRSWSGQKSAPAAIPAGRDAWVQSNFLMRHCSSLGSKGRLAVNRSITLTYRTGSTTEMQVISVTGARILVTRGPIHPSLPINRTG